MRRLMVSLLIGVLAAACILDPYALHANASDAVLHAPWWQTGLALLDVGLLGTALSLVWRGRDAAAFKLIGVEALFNLIVNLAWLLRDGVGRFVRGFGGEEYLSVYLILIALRVVLLLVLSNERPRPSGATVSSS